MRLNLTSPSQILFIKKFVPNLGLGLLLTLLAVIILTPEHHNYTYTILNIHKMYLNIDIGIDPLSRLMGIYIILIASLIYQFATNYLKSDIKRNTFIFQFLLVVLSALLLSVSQNLVTAFIAWQFMGINLYLLLNYYHHDARANKSAKKKFVINRIGDCTFLTAIIIALHTQNNTSFTTLSHTTASTEIGALLFISVLTKCAQFPFHIWLLDTMEAPTPVSALMHAGIINSGGILLTRISHLLITNKVLLLIMLLSSLITITLTGFWKKHQPDIKKQLAYSTSGQMGYMIMQCSVGAFPAAVLHLITHGFFKATLFLNSGDTLYQSKKIKNKASSTHITQTTIVALIISLACYYFCKIINLTLPILIDAFIVVTIFSAVWLVATSHTKKKIINILIYGIITIIVMIYLSILQMVSTHLNQYQFLENTLPTKIQIVAICLIGLLFIASKKINISSCILPDSTEIFLRNYILNPTRAIGDKLSFLFDNKRNAYLVLFVIIAGCFLGLILNTNLITIPKPIKSLLITLYLVLNILILLAANKAHSFKKLVVMLFYYQVVFIIYALLHKSAQLNNVIIYSCINMAPIFLLLLHVAKHRNDYPKYYLTTLLLLLIGVPGSASFIVEISLLNAIFQMGYLYIFLYLSGIMMLSLTVMHALQLYSYGHNDRLEICHTNTVDKIYFYAVLAINIFCGVFPHNLLLAL